MQKAISYIILVFFYNTAYSQDISGTWYGSYNKSRFDKGLHELVFYIEQYDDTLIRGIRTQFYDKNRFESYTISGIYNHANSTISIKEEKQLSQNADGFGDSGNYKMKLRVTPEEQYLEGKWNNASRGLFTSFTSKVYLTKKDTTSPSSSITNTTTKIIHTIELDSTEYGELKIEITDNAKVDGDVVSIYQNDVVINEKITLSKTPKTYIINLGIQQHPTTIKMVAENQGSIPPCTATMKITTKHKSYQLSMESNTLYNSAVVITIRK
ncbi:MAG: hypothetical protein J0L80_17160 [Chitinophagales bacterium]|nr:hypothetical protein [Chitinophagales bacterium]